VEIPRPSDRDRERFRSAVPDDPRVQVKPMFGNLAAFVNGNMFMGLFGADLGLRLPPDDAAALLALPGAGPYGPAERPMGGWVTMPAAIVGSPDGAAWVGRALAHVSNLPPKTSKR
jgi:TfoX N-terminal domain